MPLLRKYIIFLLSDVAAVFTFIIKGVFFSERFRKNRKTLRILVYHSVLSGSFHRDPGECNVGLGAFEKQLIVLKKRFGEIIPLKEGVRRLEKKNLMRDSVAITFDDGTGDLFDGAVRALETHGVPATFFIICKYADKTSNLPTPEFSRGKRSMDWAAVRLLKTEGFEIGSHSYSHRRLSELGDDELDKETTLSKRRLFENGIDAEYFAYPRGFYGDFSERTEAFVRSAGYKACFTNIMGENNPGDNLFELKRTRVSWRDTGFRYLMKINGAYDWVDTMKHALSRKKTC